VAGYGRDEISLYV